MIEIVTLSFNVPLFGKMGTGQTVSAASIDEELDSLLKSTGAEAAELFLKDPMGDRLWMAAHSGLAVRAFKQRLSFTVGEGFPGLVAEKDRPLGTASLPLDNRYLRDRVQEKGFNSYLCVPLHDRIALAGTLHIASRSKEENLLDQLPTVTHAAARIAEIIELEQLRLKQDIAGIASDAALDLKKNLRRKLESSLARIIEAIGASDGIILLCDSSSGSLHPWVWKGSFDKACSPLARAGGELSKCSAIDGKHGLTLNTDEQLCSQPCAVAPSGLAAITCLPLVSGGRVLGAVSIGYRRNSIFPGRHLVTTAAAVEQLSVLINNDLVAIEAEERAARSEHRRTVRKASGSQSVNLQFQPEGQFLDIHCLGPLSIYRDGQLLLPEKFERKRSITLLKILLANYGKPVIRDVLIELLWPKLQPRDPDRQLRVVVHYLRKAMQREGAYGDKTNYIVREGEGYAFDTTQPHRVDSQEFLAMATWGEELAKRGDDDDALAAFRAAIDIYQGDFLVEERYSDWCKDEREFYREHYVSSLCTVAELLLGRGDDCGAVVSYRQALLADRTREDVHRELIKTLWQAGRESDAIKHYYSLVDLYQRELGISPNSETQKLYERIAESSRHLKAEVS